MDFGRVIRILRDAEVEFVVIGGLAASLQGSTRLTIDLDLCFSRNPLNLRRLADALAPYHPRPRDIPDDVPFVWDASTLRNGTLFTLTTEIGPIDLLAEVAGIGSYDEVRTSSVEVDVFGCRFRTLDLAALIRSKRAAGRGKDLADVIELESLLEATSPPESDTSPN
jgi:predicted nucleotidyltransferase